MNKGDDIITTFLGGCIGLVVIGILFVTILSWIF
jgi:chemotaxis receptor (MCP) glutamine deamidase CheD